MAPTLVHSIDQLLPTIQVGDAFDLQAGSRVGRLRVRGTVRVEHRAEHGATIAVDARVLGVRSRGSVDVALQDDGGISIVVHGLPFLAIGVVGRPGELRRDGFQLDIEPGDTLHVTSGDRTLDILATGLRVGAISLALVRQHG